jgi:hypothetical protein
VINIDISRLLKMPASGYLCALMPGLFFEISVYLANPFLVGGIIARARTGFPLGYYSCLGVTLILAFILGNALMWFASFVNWALGYVYRIRALLWRRFLSEPIEKLFVRLQQWSDRRRVLPLNALLSDARSAIWPTSAVLSEVNGCLGMACASLLRSRYGMDEATQSGEGWEVWYAVLGKPTEAESRRAVGAGATQATGWAGLAAIYFAPHLRSGYFEAVSFSLIFLGALYGWYATKRVPDPVQHSLTKIRRVLAELREMERGRGPSASGAPSGEPRQRG